MKNARFESLYPENAYFDQVEKVLSFIKKGNSCQLIGLPGTGRANLLGLLSFNRQVRIKHLGENHRWFHFVLLNFAEIRGKSVADALKFLLLELVDSLRERKMDEEYQKAGGILKETLQYNDEMVLFQGLKRTIDYLSLEKELTVVCLFEKFEEYVPMVTPDFFSHLTILRDRAKYRFSVVFSLTRPLEQLLDPVTLTDFYSIVSGHSVYLPLSDKPALVFRLSYLEKAIGKSLTPEQKQTILTLTAGHGKLTRICVEEVLSSNVILIRRLAPIKSELTEKNPVKNELDPSVATLSQDDIQNFLKENKAVRSVNYEIWNALLPQERQFLLHIEKDQKPDQSNLYLEHVGLLLKNKITIPLFESFVEYRINHVNEEKITLNAQTNEILRGQEVISDLLTKAEVRLLRFLLENASRIVERDEMINVVWADLQSKEGVTDQALDQLIFRVRRKIETDPNNPVHLQTVKGRGFKFTP